MLKRLIVFLLILVLLAAGFFLPVTQRKTIDISATFTNTVSTLTNLNDWKKWYPEIKKYYPSDTSACSITGDDGGKNYTINIPGRKILVRKLNPSSYEVSGPENNFAFSVFPGKKPGEMNVYLVNKTPLFFTFFRKEMTGETVINSLKSYLEDEKSFYGFEIQPAKIRDSIIASKVFRIKRKDLFTTIQLGNQVLKKYIAEKNLVKTDPTSISYIPLSGDSLRVTVGFPVNQFATPAQGVNCLLLPGKGNILVGIYRGKFSERQSIYNAMSNYEANHSMAAPSEPFERYLNDSLPESDSSQIHIELNYPIY
ncbi:MAG TPA: hypothetical protein VG847_09815 [Chitinophagaceae bacterium]|nr:hypothetical protein [Chitinophagaceae bacterium]